MIIILNIYIFFYLYFSSFYSYVYFSFFIYFYYLFNHLIYQLCLALSLFIIFVMFGISDQFLIFIVFIRSFSIFNLNLVFTSSFSHYFVLKLVLNVILNVFMNVIILTFIYHDWKVMLNITKIFNYLHRISIY
jgi:hypothetical protein